MRSISQTLAFVKREITEVLHQPRLVLVLVIGPFIVMLLFGVGYRNEPLRLRTVLVGPEGSPLTEVTDQFEERLGDSIDLQGVTSDVLSARNRLSRGDVDLVVVFPDDVTETVLAGEQAQISVFHEKLDPIQQVAVDFASRLAAEEVNAAVLAEVVRRGQESVTTADEVLAQLETSSDQLRREADTDPQRAAAVAGDVATSARALAAVVGTTNAVSEAVDGTVPETSALVEQLATDLAQEAEEVDAASDDPAESRRAVLELADSIDELTVTAETLETVEPGVLVRPFVADATLVAPEEVEIIDFFAPAAVALLAQHLGVSIGALSFVRDRRLGLEELYRVGPVGTVTPLLGKFLAYAILAGALGAGLLALVVTGLGVPALGSLWETAAVLALVVAASVAIGLLLSLLAQTDSQAVQYSMLVLLASLFFSGFILDLERLRNPVLAISRVLPVTYGTRMLRDVMLLGRSADDTDLIRVGILAAAALLLALFLLHRRLKVR